MSAEIIDLAAVIATRSGRSVLATTAAAREASLDQGARFHFWTGASGKRYVHTVYSLFDCPALSSANYVLVRRASRSAREVLAIGRLTSDDAAANLSDIRQHASLVGADEVHVHLLAGSEDEAYAVEVDLRTAQTMTRPA